MRILVSSVIRSVCRATSYKTYVLIDVLYTVLSALPVVSHVVQLFLEPYAVFQVLAFSEAFPLSLSCSSIFKMQIYFTECTRVLRMRVLRMRYTTGQLMTYKQTYIQTQLAFTSPVRGSPNYIDGLYDHTNCGADIMGQMSPLQHQTTCSYYSFITHAYIKAAK